MITSDFPVRYLSNGFRRARTWQGHQRRRPDAGRAEAARRPAGPDQRRHHPESGSCGRGLRGRDILIRDGKIAQVGEDLARKAGEAVVIDAAGTIAVPGFVDAHVHAWEGQLRGAAPTLDFGGYLSFTAFGYGPHYRPHDNYVGTLAAALVALDAGITTIVDPPHCQRDPGRPGCLAMGARHLVRVGLRQHTVASRARGHLVSATAASAAEANNCRRASSAVIHPRCSHSRPASESPAITTSPNGMER